MIPFEGTVWRIMFASDAERATHPVGSPEGRFHHDGQPAIYTSLAPEGCGVAIRRYLRRDDPPRIIVPLTIQAERISDLTAEGAAPSIVWQDLRKAGEAAPTWALSDAARAAGAQGLLYRSRSRPDLIHLTLFDRDVIQSKGTPEVWHKSD